MFEEIFVPALGVSNHIKSSRSVFHIFTRTEKPTDNSTAMFIHELEECEMRDITTGRNVGAKNIGKVGQDGRIGEEMLWVQSGLLKRWLNHPDTRVLCKPVILVKLDEPLAKLGRNREKKAGSDDGVPQG